MIVRDVSSKWDGSENLIANIKGVLFFTVRGGWESDSFGTLAVFNATPFTTSVHIDGIQKDLKPYRGTQFELKVVGTRPKLAVEVLYVEMEATRKLAIPLLTKMGDDWARYRLDPDNEITFI